MARSIFMIPAFLIVFVMWFAGFYRASEGWHYVLVAVLCIPLTVAVVLQGKDKRN